MPEKSKPKPEVEISTADQKIMQDWERHRMRAIKAACTPKPLDPANPMAMLAHGWEKERDGSNLTPNDIGTKRWSEFWFAFEEPGERAVNRNEKPKQTQSKGGKFNFGPPDEPTAEKNKKDA